jgi:hypothetical protein
MVAQSSWLNDVGAEHRVERAPGAHARNRGADIRCEAGKAVRAGLALAADLDALKTRARRERDAQRGALGLRVRVPRHLDVALVDPQRAERLAESGDCLNCNKSDYKQG